MAKDLISSLFVMTGFYHDPDMNMDSNSMVYVSYEKAKEALKLFASNKHGYYEALHLYKAEESEDGEIVGSGDPIICFDRSRIKTQKAKRKATRKARWKAIRKAMREENNGRKPRNGKRGKRYGSLRCQ